MTVPAEKLAAVEALFHEMARRNVDAAKAGTRIMESHRGKPQIVKTSEVAGEMKRRSITLAPDEPLQEMTILHSIAKRVLPKYRSEFTRWKNAKSRSIHP